MKTASIENSNTQAIENSYQASLNESRISVDRIFACTLVAQWIFGVICSFLVSPLAWEGTSSTTHPHVWSAIFLGGLIVSLPTLLVIISPGKLHTRLSVATGQLLFSALLIHLMGGRIEAHFHIFVSLAMLNAYRDYRVFIPAVTVTVLDHLIRGYWWPQSVFGELAVGTWRPFEHAAWVAFEVLALCLLIRRNLQQVRSLATLQCSLADQCATLELRVAERTKELSDSQAFQESILNSIEAAVCIIDSRGEIVFVNEPWRSFANDNQGTPHATRVGENYLVACLSDESPSWEQSHELASAIREVRSGVRASYACEMECHSMHDKRWLHISINSVDLEGKQAIAVTHVDVSDTHQARSRAAALAKLVIDSPHEVYIFSQTDFRFVEVNAGACHNLGYSREELLQMTPGSIKPNYDDDQLRDLFDGLINGKDEFIKFETVHERKDKSTYDCAISLHCSSLEGEDVFVAFVTDVSEQLELEAQLAQARKLESIGQLAAGVAHEINTPMQCVFGNVEFLGTCFNRVLNVVDKLIEIAENDEESPAVKALLEQHRYDYLREQTPMALQESANASTQVISVIRAMKIMSHPGTTEKTMTDIHDILQNAATLTRGRWKCVAEIEFDLDPNLGMIEVLPAEISQVFVNMIVNASDAIAEKIGEEPEHLGTIQLRTRNDGQVATIEISDSGLGIPEKIQRQIFDKFFTTKPVGKGTGQGLAISHNVVVKKHGGSIEVRSEEGKGTTFVLTIPRSTNNQAPLIDLPLSSVHNSEAIA